MKEIQISKKSKKVKVRGDDGHKIISIRILVEMLEELDALADKTDRSRNEVMNILLRAALENVTIIDE